VIRGARFVFGRGAGILARVMVVKKARGQGCPRPGKTPMLYAAVLLSFAMPSLAQAPWVERGLSPDARAALLEKAMTLEERIGLVHSQWALPSGGAGIPKGAIGGAGFTAGIERLGVPAIQETDAGLGVTNPVDVRKGDSATAFPASLALAASFDAELAHAVGVAVGAEARAKGFAVLLGPGLNLARDPRNGRNFEYLGEDPLLAGILAGELSRGLQSQGVVATVKHFAINDQESNRSSANARISEAAMRESDLLAFQIAIEHGHPGAVMCAYNLVNGQHACGHDGLLNKTLKVDWGFPGFVMSDWGAVHATDYALKGLDRQSGEQLDSAVYFGEPLKAAVQAGTVPAARLSDMTRRILRALFAAGVFDRPSTPPTVDQARHAELARRAAAEGMVLLKNRDGLLPLAAGARRIAVIGGLADKGVLAGGGSSEVMPPRGFGARIEIGGEGGMAAMWNAAYHRAPPLAAIRARNRPAEVRFDPGRYPSSAALLARSADVAIVFATQWMGEGIDAADLGLPQGQDALIEAVVAANPNTIVVLQTGGPVLMPWLDRVAAVLAAWYPGQEGGEAIADVLFGAADPSGRLPITFPAGLEQLPRPALPGYGLREGERYDIDYVEGADVGYRWFARTGRAPLFPFGFGLSYTSFAYRDLQVSGGETIAIRFKVANTGPRRGAAMPQAYLVSAAGTARMRLVSFAKVPLAPGETREVSLEADPRLLADFDEAAHGWRIAGGEYRIVVGPAAGAVALSGTARVEARTLPP
jgi:beta-glucosidase